MLSYDLRLITLSINGTLDRLNWVKSHLDAISNCPPGKADLLGKLTYRQDFIMKVKQHIPSCIVQLLLFCCPSAIRRFVISIWINAVNAQSRWLAAHVFEKVFKSLPSFANANAAATIEFVDSRLRSSTTFEHRCPCPILRCVGHTMSRASFVVATTVFGFAIHQGTEIHKTLRSAAATAKNLFFVFVIRASSFWADCQPITELHSWFYISHPHIRFEYYKTRRSGKWQI